MEGKKHHHNMNVNGVHKNGRELVQIHNQVLEIQQDGGEMGMRLTMMKMQW
jgi:hypothetical protein